MHIDTEQRDQAEEEILTSMFSDEQLEAAAGPSREAGVPPSQPGQPWCTAPHPYGGSAPPHLSTSGATSVRRCAF
jgi:hypothetical protein